MMRLLATASLFLMSSSVGAQALTVTASTPTNGATNVALTSTVSFTFSEAVVDPGTAPPTVVWFPADSVGVGDPSLSTDGRTISYPVDLRAGTRYVAVLLAAEAESGGELSRPFALNMTTSATNGNLNVSGTVTTSGGEPVDGTLVALVTGDITTGAIDIAYVRVLDGQAASQAYNVGPVPLGIYTVAALRLPVGGAVPGFGYYDPDGDGTPNPVLLPFNVNVTLGLPDGRTAGSGFDDIAEAAAGVDPGSEWMGVLAPTVDADGKSRAWSYSFRTPAPESRTFSVARLGLFVLPIEQQIDVGDGDPLPRPFSDTDALMVVAESAAGAAFRTAHAGDVVTVAVEGTDDSVSIPFNVPAWAVAYFASDTQGGAFSDYVGVYVDFVTGALLGTTSAEAIPEPHAGDISLVSANPFSSEVMLSLEMVAAGPARISVVDATGRTVAVLAEGVLGRGTHPLTWRPSGSAASGVYWVRAQTLGQVRSVAVVFAR